MFYKIIKKIETCDMYIIIDIGNIVCYHMSSIGPVVLSISLLNAHCVLNAHV
jgi:hypothetical protein